MFTATVRENKCLIMKLISRIENGMGMFECPECGKITKKSLSNGKKQNVCERSCCNYATIHGDSSSGIKLYRTWANMKHRCYNKNYKESKYYGDRGIKVCAEWHEYLNFKKWALENGYTEGLSIDRIDSDKDYCPENCQWINLSKHASKTNYERVKFTMGEVEQIKKIHVFGEFTKAKLSRVYGISESAMGRLIRNITYIERQENPVCLQNAIT